MAWVINAADGFTSLSHGALAALWLLTYKVAHHLRRVVGRGGDAQQLLAPGHCGVIDGLDVDIMSSH